MRLRTVRRHQQPEASGPQRALSGALGIGAVGAGDFHLAEKAFENRFVLRGDCVECGLAPLMNGARIGRGARGSNGLGQVVLGRERER